MTELTLKSALAAFDIGTGFAEDDIRSGMPFIETEAGKSYKSGEADIIVGPRGCGKTNLVYEVLRETQVAADKRFDYVLAPSSEIGAFISASRFEGVADANSAKAIWQILACYFIARYLAKEGYNSSTYSKLAKTLRLSGIEVELPSLADATNVFAQRVLNYVGGIRLSGNLSADIVNSGVDVEVGGSKDGLDEIRQNASLAWSYAREVCAERNKDIWVVFDRTDTVYSGRRDFESFGLARLAEIARDLLSLDGLDESEVRIQFKLFLKFDAWVRIIRQEMVEQAHLARKKTQVAWRKDDIVDLLYGRLSKPEGLFAKIGGAQDVFLEYKDREKALNRLFPRGMPLAPRTGSVAQTR